MNARLAFALGLVAGIVLTAIVCEAVRLREPKTYADCLLRNSTGNKDLVILGCIEKFPRGSQ